MGVSRFIRNKRTVKEMPPICSRKRVDLWSAVADSLYTENMNWAKKWLGWFQILMATYGASALLQPVEGCKQFGSLQPLHLNIVLPLNPLKGSEKCGARMWHLFNWWWDLLLTGLEDERRRLFFKTTEKHLWSDTFLSPLHWKHSDISHGKATAANFHDIRVMISSHHILYLQKVQRSCRIEFKIFNLKLLKRIFSFISISPPPCGQSTTSFICEFCNIQPQNSFFFSKPHKNSS